MQYVQPAVPLLLFAVILALILRSALRGRFSRPRAARAKPQPRPRSTATLRDVSRDRMDDELNELLRRRT